MRKSSQVSLLTSCVHCSGIHDCSTSSSVWLNGVIGKCDRTTLVSAPKFHNTIHLYHYTNMPWRRFCGKVVRHRLSYRLLINNFLSDPKAINWFHPLFFLGKSHHGSDRGGRLQSGRTRHCCPTSARTATGDRGHTDILARLLQGCGGSQGAVRVRAGPHKAVRHKGGLLPGRLRA